MKSKKHPGRAPASPRREERRARVEAPRPAAAASDRTVRPGWALLGVVAVAAALRLWQVAHGLPEFTDEAIPFRRALQMWRHGDAVDLNPHFFHYPSLTIYLQLLIQKLHYLAGRSWGAFASPADYVVSFQTDPTAMVVLARLSGIAADLGTVFCVWRIGERLWPGAGLLGAFLAACAPALIRASGGIFADSFMILFATAAVERMLAWRERGGATRLAAVAILVGLAAGAKYPGAVTLLPLAWVLWERERARAPLRWVAVAAGALGVFLITTPYAVLDFATFRRDFEFVGRMSAEGHLGNIDRTGFRYHVVNLARELGWVGSAFLPVSLLFTLRRAATRAATVAVWLALLGFALPIFFAHVMAERYVGPVTPFAAALAAAAALELGERLRAPRWRAIPAAVALGLGLPALVTGVVASAGVAESTREQARRWCERQLGTGDLLLQEHYGAPLLSRLDWYALQSGPGFAAASEPVRQKLARRRWFSTVTLPLAVVGSTDNAFRGADGSVARVPVFEHVADYNQIFYDPRLLGGVDYVLTSDAVRGRFEADRGRYAAQNRFYALLDSAAEVAARFAPRGVRRGPEIVIYRLGPRARSAVAAFGPLDPLWWAEYVPDRYRREAQAILAPGAEPTEALRDRSGEPAPWVQSLNRIFAGRYGPSTFALAVELMQHGHGAEARRLAEAVLVMDPGNIEACLIQSMACQSLGVWAEARRALERTLAWLEQARTSSLPLRLEYADLLAHQGEVERARGQLEALIVSGDARAAGEARRRLEDPNGAFARGR